MDRRPTYEELERRVQELEQSLALRCPASADRRVETASQGSFSTADGICFEDLFNLDDIQRLQDQFAAATGVASMITRPDGEPITKPSRFCEFCRMVRSSEEGLRRCRTSDAHIGVYREDGPTITPCLSGGLWDAGAGISVGGYHLANWLVGQVRDEEQGEDRIRACAREIGLDEDELARAFHDVPVMSREQFSRVSQVLFTLANQLSRIAYDNVRLARSIEERERMVEATKRSDAFYHTLVETIPDLIWLKDLDGVFVSCNQAFGVLYGARQEEILGKTDYDFVDDELADFFRLNDLKALEAGGPRKNEEWLVFAEGGYRGLFETIKTPMYDDTGTAVGVLGIARDITARHQAEEELLESQERYRSLHDASLGGIGIHDNGRILLCNQGLSDMTGYSNDELIGMDGLLLIAESMRDMVRGMISEGFEGASEILGVRKNGEEYPMRVEAHNVPYKGKMVRTVEFRDITEIKQAQEEQQRLQDQLHQAQKMETVGQLAGGVAHDFNNLLQVILGYGQFALETADRDDPVHECIEQIMNAGHRARTLVAQLLAFSRRQVLQVKVLDLNDAVNDSLEILNRVIGEHVTLVFHPGKDLSSVLADSGRVGQILTNLCVNARDAMPEGGTITISTSMVERIEDIHGVRGPEDSDRFVRLNVADTGCGMDQSVREQAFEPFFTTKSVGEGTGLGLSTVYGLVKQYHGFVTVISEVDCGTTFSIDLPPADREVSGTMLQETEAEVRGGLETILLAEDDAMVRRLTTTILERAGYTVFQARDGEEALSVFEARIDEIDLLLLDVVMPNLGGRAVHDRIQAIRPGLPAIFASGYSMNAIHTDFVLDDGLVLIQKPAERNELLNRVREMLDAAYGRRPT